jgi:flagellar hook-associated protein 2
MASTSIGSSASSGIDVDATVSQILYAERAPERLMEAQRTKLQLQAASVSQLQMELSALESRVNALKDVSGALNANVATSSNASVFTASASTTAATGKHTLLVSRLATTSTYHSDVVSGTKLPHGSFSLSVGGGQVKTITISDSNDTLSGFVSYVNGLNVEVTANTLTDAHGTRLVLVSQQSGSAGQISISGSSIPFAWNKGTDGLNAQFTLDGIPLESATNTPSEVIPGVTLTLAGTSAGEVQLTIAPDSGRARQAIADFVSAYNTIVKNINGQFSYDVGSKTAGVLSGDPSVRWLQGVLLSDAAYAKDKTSPIVNLGALGVRMGNDGTLTIDSSKLDDMLKTRFADVQDFFQSTDVQGFARHFGTSLDELTDSIDGPIQVDLNGIKAEQESLSDQIEAYEVRMEMRQQLLLEQFSKIDAMLRQLPLLQAQLTAQLGSLK